MGWSKVGTEKDDRPGQVRALDVKVRVADGTRTARRLARAPQDRSGRLPVDWGRRLPYRLPGPLDPALACSGARAWG